MVDEELIENAHGRKNKPNLSREGKGDGCVGNNASISMG